MSTLPTTTAPATIRAILSALESHAWPSPIAQIGLRGPTDLIQADSTELAIATPALYLHLAESRSDDEALDARVKAPTVGRIKRVHQFQLYCLLGQTTPDLPIEIYAMSESVVALINRREFSQSPRLGHRWGLSAAVGYPLMIEDVESDLGLQGVAARLVQWEQAIYLPELTPVQV